MAVVDFLNLIGLGLSGVQTAYAMLTYHNSPGKTGFFTVWPRVIKIIRIGLPCLIGIIFLFFYFRPVGVSPDQFEILKKSWAVYKYENVLGQHYKDETVKLDGKEFQFCVFDNVEFVYNGTAPFKIMLGNTMVHRQSIRIMSENPIVVQALSLLVHSAMKPEDVQESNRPSNAN